MPEVHKCYNQQKASVSMSLEQSGFAIPTQIAFFTFEWFINVHLTLLNSLLFTLYTQSALFMASHM